MRTTLSYTLAVDEFPVEAVDILTELWRDHGLRITWKPSQLGEAKLTLGGEGISGGVPWDCECSFGSREGSASSYEKPLRAATFRALSALHDSLGRMVAGATSDARRSKSAARREQASDMASKLTSKRAALGAALSKLSEEWPRESTDEETKGGDDDE